MKCLAGDYLLQLAAILLLIFPCIYATPPMYSLFQGAPYTNPIPRQRNKNWCAFVLHKNVTCAVLGATETITESDAAPCPEHFPNCAQTGIYRTHVRPMYKVGYKQVTELEWKCCPGYRGYDCMELKDAPSPSHHLWEPRQDLTSVHKPQQSALGPGVSTGGFHAWIQSAHTEQTRHPWTDGRESGRGTQNDIHRVSELEEEMQRLSQSVLDLQSAMTSTNANLRLDLQEDASKIILSLLNNLRLPQDALTGGTESIVLPTDLTIPPVSDELWSKITHLSETISTNTNTIQGLATRLLQLEGQVNRLTEAAGSTSIPLPSSASTTDCSCQTYINQKLEDFQMEILEGMDIKLADLKNACDYKVLSVKEQCEEQENSYLSLTELLESKEADLRQEIQILRNKFASGTLKELAIQNIQVEIQSLKNAYQMLASDVNATKMQHNTLEDTLNARVSLAEKSADMHCSQLEEKLREVVAQEEQAQSKVLESKISEALQVPEGAQSQTPTSEMEKNTSSMKAEMSSLVQQVKNLEISVHVINESVFHKNYTDKLFNKLNKFEEDCARSQEAVKRVEAQLTGLDERVGSVEGVCGRFEPMSDSLKRIKDGLNKHVNGLWNCVRKLNNTVLTHSTDINTLREKTQPTVDRKHGTTGTQHYTGVLGGMDDSSSITEKVHPVLESGEAGPPGTKHSLHSPQGTNGEMTPVKGYAAAPGYPPPSPVSFTTLNLSGTNSVSTLVSFLAGMTLNPFSEEVGIIRFNSVLLNDGGHYDPHTGVFTVPADGRYLLSVVIIAQTGERVEAVLSVANRSIQKLETTGSRDVASTECHCGGSASTSLVLDLKQSQRVAVVKTSGTLAVSASTEVLSTFSGVLLYLLPAKR